MKAALSRPDATEPLVQSLSPVYLSVGGKTHTAHLIFGYDARTSTGLFAMTLRHERY